jgi:GNAT superfamily N-acetyltransferase
MHILTEEHDPEKIKQILQQALREYNHDFFGSYELKKFAIYIHNDCLETIAGIYGFVLEQYQTIRLEFVWVKQEYRRQGIGKKLFEHIEQYALSKCCHSIQVSTMDFQAPSFYKKMGYECIGRIPKWFGNHDEIFFLKNLNH